MKVFIHIDMDCYYSQAECKRLFLDPTKPICARQWNSLIAVNYPARKLGVTRGMLAQEAQKICPDILLPHIDTFKIVDGQIQFSTLDTKFQSHFQEEEKITLQFFREESKLIFEVLRKHFQQVEKGGCDEAYIELSQDEIEKLYQYEPKVCGVIMTAEGQTEDILQLDEEEQILLRTSQWVNMVRQEIKNITQYECSAGISYNKMLAKLASAANKPNNQTIVLARYVPQCIRSFKIGKIRGFNGKIRQAFSNHKMFTLGEAQDGSLDQLKEIFGGDIDQANHVYQKIRGFDDEPLKLNPDPKTKTIMSLKNIKKMERSQKSFLDPILELLFFDISMRITDFYDDSGFVPSVLNVIYVNADSGQHQKSEPLLLSLPIHSFKQSIADTARIIFTNQLFEQHLYPLINIGLCVRSFIPIKQNKIEYKFTLKEFTDKVSENSKLKLLTEVEQMLNPENYFDCEQCQQKILKNDQKEHYDFHFAMSIDQEVNPNRKRQKLNLTQIQVPKIKPEGLCEEASITQKAPGQENTSVLQKVSLQKASKTKIIPKQENTKSIMNYFQPSKK